MQDRSGDTANLKNEEEQHLESKDTKDKESKPYKLLPILKLFLTMHYGFWLIMVLIVGLIHGFIEGTVPWHLDHMREFIVKF